MSRTYININSEILRWARNRSHYPTEVLAKKVGVSTDRYKEWESGRAKPTMRYFYKLVTTLNLPLQTFFMEEIPREREVLTEMRRLPGSPIGEESPELTLQVHLALERRDIGLNLYNDLNEQPPTITQKVNLTDDPERIGKSLRESLGILIKNQESWTDPYEALRAWRTALEDRGVLVFQIPRISLEEMRGFTVAVHPLPIIGVNSKDSPRGRIFTILHEFAHILLGDTVLHAPQKWWFQLAPNFNEEYFYNRLAAAVLVPKNDLLSYLRNRGKQKREDWEDREIDSLVSRYKVSSAVIIRRLHKFNLISADSYQSFLQQYDNFEQKTPEQQGGDFYANQISHLGTLIPRLAFKGYYDNKITVSDLSSILGLQVKKIGRLEYKIFGYNYGFERL